MAETETATKAIHDTATKSLHDIGAEVEKQRKSISMLVKSSKELTGTKNDLETAQRALKIAKDAKKQSEKFGVVQAWAIWDSVIEEFSEIEHYLIRWEEKNALMRDSSAAQSLEASERNLKSLNKDTNFPSNIKSLYLKRHRKYEILVKLREAFEPVAGRYEHIDFTLPAPPRLPSGISFSSRSAITSGTVQ